MKKILTILIILTLISCKEDVTEPQIFTSIEGKWGFDAYGMIAGSYEITGLNGAYKVKAGGTFNIDGKVFTTIETNIQQSSLDPPILDQILLKTDTGEFIDFTYINIDISDYRFIYASNFHFKSKTSDFDFNSTVQISRK